MARAAWAPSSRSAGAKSLTARHPELGDVSAPLAAMLKRNQLPWAGGEGRNGSEICTSKRQGELLLSEGLVLFPSAAPERARISFII